MARAFHDGIRAVAAQAGFDERLDLVITTGDVVESAKPAEYIKASKFFEELASSFKLAPKRLVFVPGNHDVSWTECKRVDKKLDEQVFDSPNERERTLRARMDEVKLSCYREFIQEVCGTDVRTRGKALGSDAFVFDFPELSLSVGALNSCVLESHRSKDHVGFLDKAQAQALMDVWKDESHRDYIKVIALHHNPVATVPENLKEWRKHILERQRKQGQETIEEDVLRRYEADVVGLEGKERLEAIVKDAHVQLVLFGHQHALDVKLWPWRKDGNAHLLSAGSGGLLNDKLPGEHRNSLRLISLDPEAGRIKAHALVWDPMARRHGSVTKGAFVQDQAEGGIYDQPLHLPDGVRTGPTPLTERNEEPPRTRFSPKQS